MNRVERHIEALRELLRYDKPCDFCVYNFSYNKKRDCLLCVTFIDNKRDGRITHVSNVEQWIGEEPIDPLPFVCPCYYYDTKQEAIDRSWLAIEAWEDRHGEGTG